MALSAGVRLGPYEILELLGAGGMGEVYRARDTKLDRDVALKVLPEAFTSDADRLARFEREAKVLASLNHPHIGHIYGLEEADGQRALVLELVEGSTLADRIAEGAIPLDQALPMARQIAEALEAAHERGIVHRDLKPANVKVKRNGALKVLDFGLAKAGGPQGDDSDVSQSPTLSARTTQAGVILGTAAYMAPEQASGIPVDKRADIWAFGAVLFEMITGRRLFTGANTSEVLASVIKDEPDWASLPSATPPSVRRLLLRCLVRDRFDRLRDIGEARIVLSGPEPDSEAGVISGSAGADRRAGSPGLTRNWRAAAVLAAIGAALSGAWLVLRPIGAPPREVSRLELNLPSDQQLVIRGRSYPMALSPDGRRLVYAADDAGETHLYLRELDSFGVRKLPGTQAARYPFFSPDGEWIGYFAEGQLLKVAFDQGPPSPLCEAEPLRGAAWSPNGWIYFSQITRGTVTDETPSPAAAPSDLAIQGVSYRLLRVPETGGTPEPVISSQPEAEDGGHRFPSPLPDGRGLITRASGGVIALLSFDTGEWTSLGPGEQARYVEPGFLAIHAGRGQIRVAPFDLETQRLEGEPRPIVDGIYRSPNGGGAFFAVSQRGDLVYVPGGYDRTLERVDRSGRSAPLISDVRGFRLPRLSPDARALAAIVDPRPSELWTYDLERGSQNRLFRDGHNLVPVWSPDGASIAWTSNGDILRIPADGSGATEPMLARPGPQYVTDWSPDGRYLVYNHEVRSSSDIWLLPLGEEPRPLVSTAADEQHARISPDGKWFVYESNETGRFEVYVRSFPDGSNQRTVSVGGGRHPAWASGGRELFFHDESGMYVVGVRTDPAFGAASPHHLFDWPHGLVHDFDVAPDGDWFAMVRSDPETSPDHFRVVLNWASELEEKLRPAP